VAGQQAMTTVGKVTPTSGVKSNEAQIFVNAIRGEGELFVTADQAYTVTRILEAIYTSSKTGKPVYF
jgi:predicted dehydrogenase